MTFSNDEEAEVRRRAIGLGLERRIGDRWAIQLNGGLSVGGDLTVGAERYEFQPGWFASLTGSFRVLDGEELLPFLLIGLSGAVGSAQLENPVEEAMFTTLDFRGSVTVGKLFWEAIAPFAVARVFGGPIYWERRGEDLTGTDDYHFQLGAGLLVTANGRVNAYTEIVPLGERAASFGMSVAF